MSADGSAAPGEWMIPGGPQGHPNGAQRARAVHPTAALLSRTDLCPAAPVRMVHLGLGNFFRAHQCWYTARASNADEWGIAAFTGRGPTLADVMGAQEGLYTLITRGATEEFEIVTAVSRVHRAGEHEAWLSYFAAPEVGVVTLTVTEAGYTCAATGGLDCDNPAVIADIIALQADLRAVASTAVGRLFAGFAARAAASAGPIAVVPCDNLPDNGAVLSGLVAEFTDRVMPDLRDWIESNVSFVTSMVDRITPATTAADVAAVASAAGYRDAAPVVTEPFREWVLCGEFPAGRPCWEDAGATFTADIIPYEQRKLWLLNGAHSLLAYTAPLRGHHTVAEAVADPVCRSWLEQWWDEALPHIDLPADELADYRQVLLSRFVNPRMLHQLSQIAMDGSQKLPVRILPVMRSERAAGRMPIGAVRALAGWLCHLTGSGVPVVDAAVTGVADAGVAMALLDPALATDRALCAAINVAAHRLRSGR